jgi:hypothetical protein
MVEVSVSTLLTYQACEYILNHICSKIGPRWARISHSLSRRICYLPQLPPLPASSLAPGSLTGGRTVDWTTRL